MIYYEKTNFLPDHQFQVWKNLHGPKSIPWMYMDRTSYFDNDFTDESSWHFSFGHQLLWNGQGKHPAGIAAKDLLANICEDAGIRLNGIFRIRIGLITKTPEHVIHEPHVDMPEPHLTCLYYCSSTNGNTILYNKLFQEGDPLFYHEELEKSKSIECVENKYVIFDGHQYHTSVSQTNKRQRIVITFNFENTLRNL